MASTDNFFAIDIGSTAIRAVELKGRSLPKTLVRYGSIPIDTKTAQSDSSTHKAETAKLIQQLLQQGGFSEKNVVVGIPSNKVFATVVDFPKLGEKELAKTVSYQLDSHIPNSIDEVKVDWAVIGDSPVEGKVEVLIASVSNNFAESRLDMLEDLGLNVVGIEPDALALSRSLVPFTETKPVLILDIGYTASDLVIAHKGAPRLIRSIPVGSSSLVKAAAQNLNVDNERATEFVFKFGMNTEKLEGQVYRALQSTIDSLVSEIQKSIKFFTNRYKGEAIDRIIITGRSSSIPVLPLYLANQTGVQVEIGSSWQNVNYPQNQYNQLLEISSQFSVANGLGLRIEQ